MVVLIVFFFLHCQKKRNGNNKIQNEHLHAIKFSVKTMNIKKGVQNIC